MNYVDVTPAVAPLHTEGGSIWSGQGAAHGGADVGIAVNVGAWRVRRADLQLHTGLRLGVVSMPGFAMNTWDIPAEGGWRWSGGDETDAVRPHWELGGGPHLLLLVVQGTPPQVTGALGTHTGFGVTIGRGALRAVVGLRASARVGLEQIWGTATVPDDTYGWQWTPLAARVDAYAGVSFW